MNGADSTVREDSARTPNATNAGVGAVGGGTGLVGLAHLVGVDTTLGAVLVWLAPAVSVLSAAAFYYLQIVSTRFWERRFLKNMRTTLVEQLGNPHTSDAHKARLRGWLEELDIAEASNALARVRYIGTIAIREPTSSTVAAAAAPSPKRDASGNTDVGR